MKKVLFLLGLLIGYIIGTRAGNQRYVQMKGAVERVWKTDPVQAGARRARDVFEGTVPRVVDAVSHFVVNCLDFVGALPSSRPTKRRRRTTGTSRTNLATRSGAPTTRRTSTGATGRARRSTSVTTDSATTSDSSDAN